MSGETSHGLDHRAKLNIYREKDPNNFRRSGIICTIGPVSCSVEVLTNLRKAGMEVVRLNFSHGSHEFHQKIIDNARKTDEIIGSPIAIALDTKGPEIRTGALKGDDDISIVQGQTFTLYADQAKYNEGDNDGVFVDYASLPQDVRIGSFVFIDDGLLQLEVVSVTENTVVTKAVNNAKLGSRKGVNLPEVNVRLPALSEKDKADIAFGVKNNVDIIFASFVRKKEDVQQVREALGEEGKHIQIISKIENHEGVQKYDEILEASDGIMVARGDLGIEIPPSQVFIAQKMMIARCNIVGKPVICATHMLDSMTYNPRPTRAEVSDVANAVLDGADCVMLSGESAKGKYPVETVNMMSSICYEAEAALFYPSLFQETKALTPKPLPTTETVASSAVNAAFENQAKAIITLTTTGSTARLVAKYRPSCPIVAVTRNVSTARQMALYFGVVPLLYTKPKAADWQEDVDARVQWALDHLCKRHGLKPGDGVITIQGWQGGPKHTNTMRVLWVPESPSAPGPLSTPNVPRA